MNINKNILVSRRILKNHGCIFQYIIRTDPMLVIGCDAVWWITCSCYACLRKLSFPCNIIQYNYNKDIYKGENLHCVYWPIIWPYKNWQIIHCIDSKNTT